jgi:hypothetical protein
MRFIANYPIKRAPNQKKLVLMILTGLVGSLLLTSCQSSPNPNSTKNMNEQSVIRFWNKKLNVSFDQEDRFVKTLFPSLRDTINIHSIPNYQLIFFSSEEALVKELDSLSADTDVNGSSWVSCVNVAIVFPVYYFDEFKEILDREWCITEDDVLPPENNEIESEDPVKIGILNSQEQSRNTTVKFKEDIPEFPQKVRNYALDIQEGYQKVRLFENLEWVIPIAEFNPDEGGSATMSCQPYYWIIRWRSNNPDVEISVSTGLTDGSYSPLDDVARGGAGISEGYSCVVPAFKFGRAINGNRANLVDLNFEYQLWNYKPKI